MNELNFKWRYKNYELRVYPRTLSRPNEDENETIDFIKCDKHEDDNKEYCFSLAYWKRNSEGYELNLIGSRIFEYIDEEDIEIVWEQLHVAQFALDKFWETNYKLNRKEW